MKIIGKPPGGSPHKRKIDSFSWTTFPTYWQMSIFPIKLIEFNSSLIIFSFLATKWLIENNIEKFFIDITNTKDLAWLYIDDRCINFDGNFDNLVDSVNNFKPWYKM